MPVRFRPRVGWFVWTSSGPPQHAQGPAVAAVLVDADRRAHRRGGDQMRCEACWHLAQGDVLDPLGLGDDPEQRYRRVHELMHAQNPPERRSGPMEFYSYGPADDEHALPHTSARLADAGEEGTIL